ncbi:hypothetical protein [Aquimarina sp. RZ0]|uniref:hypothetical protein n=1 Tax=Aquimarina sp. RZ0 TaxID=2607730 RepID=UPI0011F32FA4|nr:hypothetical protein [Aquimarina sp. RZ0]KAA1246281.1 hypothetical protein F0000_08280 [Aquimarina sp. RZ0]
MKRLFYVLPIIGLLLCASCDQDESNEVINENQLLDQVLPEVSDVVTVKNFGVAIAPGLYGPIHVGVLSKVTYTYHPTQAQLKAVPKAVRKYKIHFEVDDPLMAGTDWQHIVSFDVSSNSVQVKFPIQFNVGGITRWRVRYEMYNEDTLTSYSKRKVVNVNYVIPG